MIGRVHGGRECGCGLRCHGGCAYSGGWLMRLDGDFGRGVRERGRMKSMS